MARRVRERHDAGVAGAARVRYRSTVLDSNRWQRFSARAGDIIISTPAKSGTTWMQMICALLIFQRTTFDRSLDLISPCLDMQTRDIGDVIADLEAQQHRRFIKTHTPLDGLPVRSGGHLHLRRTRPPRRCHLVGALPGQHRSRSALHRSRARRRERGPRRDATRLGTGADRSARTLLATGSTIRPTAS